MSHNVHELDNTQAHPDVTLRPMASPVLKELSFCAEFYETIRRLLQHIVFVFLLAGRLYILPLLYVASSLAGPRNPWSTMNAVHSENTGAYREQHWLIGGVPKIWHSFRERILGPFRVAQNLYCLGKMLGEDPSAFRPKMLASAASMFEEAIVGDGQDGNNIAGDSTVSLQTEIESPVSASQMYHAALLNNQTLDDLLATFEVDKLDQGIVVDRILIRHSSQADVPSEKVETKCHPKRRRCSSSSIQFTAERGARLDVVDANASRIFAPRSPQPSPRQPETPLEKAIKPSGKEDVDFERHHQNKQDSPDLQGTSKRIISSAESVVRHASLQTVSRCPTFVRRHAQSLLPKRSVSGGKKSFAMLKGHDGMSTPVLPSTTSSKARARLQRRARPKPSLPNV